MWGSAADFQRHYVNSVHCFVLLRWGRGMERGGSAGKRVEQRWVCQ